MEVLLNEYLNEYKYLGVTLRKDVKRHLEKVYARQISGMKGLQV